MSALRKFLPQDRLDDLRGQCGPAVACRAVRSLPVALGGLAAAAVVVAEALEHALWGALGNLRRDDFLLGRQERLAELGVRDLAPASGHLKLLRRHCVELQALGAEHAVHLGHRHRLGGLLLGVGAEDAVHGLEATVDPRPHPRSGPLGVTVRLLLVRGHQGAGEVLVRDGAAPQAVVLAHEVPELVIADIDVEFVQDLAHLARGD